MQMDGEKDRVLKHSLSAFLKLSWTWAARRPWHRLCPKESGAAGGATMETAWLCYGDRWKEHELRARERGAGSPLVSPSLRSQSTSRPPTS